jgi:hypothetical protein
MPASPTSPNLLQEEIDASYAVYSHASIVYSSNALIEKELTQVDSSALDNLNNNSDGFYAQAFKDLSGNVIIAYEGSTPGVNIFNSYVSASDSNDVEILKGQAPAALTDAVNFAKEVQREFGSADSIYITGHSLGGAEAEAVALANGQAGLSIVGGVTFGAPGVPGYSGNGENSSILTDYVDYGDPVGNYASDSGSALNDLAPPNMDHFGVVDLIGPPSGKDALKNAEKTARVDISGGLAQFLSLLSHHDLVNQYAPDLSKTLGAPSSGAGLQTVTVNSNLAYVFNQDSAAQPSSSGTQSNAQPVVNSPTNVPAVTGEQIPLASIFTATETPAGSAYHVNHYTAFVVYGSGTIVVNNQSYALGSAATNISPAQFAIASFNAGSSPGVSEIAVVAFDDAGTSSIAGDTTITVTAPTVPPQPIVTTDHTPPTIVAPSQQLVTGVGSNPNLTSTYLSVTDSNSAHYTPGQLTYTIVSAPNHGYIIKGGSIVSSFTQADVNNGLVEYQENGTVASSDSFTYYIADPAGNRTTNTTFDITINAPPTSTHPTLDTDSALSVGQGLTAVINDSNLHVTDSGLNSWQVIYTVTGGPAHGQILADGINVVTSFTQQQVDLGLISYKNTGNLSGPDNLTFTVADSQGGTIGQTSFSINVIPKNNLQVNVERPLFTDPEGQFVLHPASAGGIPIGNTGFATFTNTPGWVSLLSSDILSAVDPGVDPSNIIYTVVGMPANAASIAVGQWGTPQQTNFVPFNGLTIAPLDITDNFPHFFTQAQVNAGQVFYIQNNEIGDGQEYYGEQFALTLSASDNAGNFLGNVVVPVILDQYGLLTDGTFVPRSQIPSPSFSAPIGEVTTIGSGLLTYISNQFADSQITYSVWFTPNDGSLLLNGNPLSAHSTFTQQDIDEGDLAYAENGTPVASDTFGLFVTDPNEPGGIQSAFQVTVNMTGTAGGQVLTGNTNSEILSAGAGSNTFIGDGNTTVSYANSPNGVTADVFHGTVSNGYGGTDTLKNIHSIIGSAFADTLGEGISTPQGPITATVQGTILSFTSSGFDATRVSSPTVAWVGNQYDMLFAGLPFANNMQIGLATSTDGVTWARYSSDPVISNAGSQSWDSFREIPVTLLYDNGTYKLWFNGNNSNLSSDPGYGTGFGYATSTDGVHWTQDPDNPIRFKLNNPNGNGFDLREVVKFNGQYDAYFVNHSPTGDILYEAQSGDGIHFSGDTPVEIAGGYTLLAATTASFGGTQEIFSVWQDSSRGNHYGISTDGLNFTIEGTLSLPANFGVNAIQIRNGELQIYGTVGVGNVNWSFGNDVIEYATAPLPINISAMAETLAGGPGADRLVLGAAALASAQAATPVLSTITDYDQGNAGLYSATEGDQIDLSALLSTAYASGNGETLESLVRAIEGPSGFANLQVDTDGAVNGTHWINIAQLDGLHVGDSVNVILDSSLPSGSTIQVAPPLTLSVAPTASFTENGAAVTLSGTASLSDLNSTTLASATVAISADTFPGDGDLLAAATVGTSITPAYNSSTETLTLTGTDTLTHYQQVLDSVTFNTSSSNPTDYGSFTTRTFLWIIDDGLASNNTSTGTSTIGVTAVDNPPTLVVTSANSTWTEEQTSPSIVSLISGVTASDPDNLNLASATVSISGGNFLTGDTLSFTNSGAVTGTYNSNAGVLVFTGSDTLTTYDTVLQSVKFSGGENPTDFGSDTHRTLTWTVDDGALSSAAVTATLSVVNVNDPPTLAMTSALSTWIEEGTSVSVISGATAVDPDNLNLASATVSISGGFFTGDTLSFINSGAVTGSYNSNTGVITLTGSDTLATYDTVLQSVKFSGGENPTDFGSDTHRTLTWTVNDGALSSAAVTATLSVVNVNDPPTLAVTSALSTWTEEGASVFVLTGVTASDPDNLNLASATVSISGGFFTGDTLSFTNSGAVTGSYSSNTGVLTFTGSDTLATYNTVLQSVKFSAGENPTNFGSDTHRTLSWMVNDGGASSTAATTTVNITNVNDPPTLAGTTNASYTQEGGAVTLSPGVTVTDPDNLALVGATVKITGGSFAGDGDVLATSTAGTSIVASYNSTIEALTLSGNDTLAHYRTVLDQVTFASGEHPTDFGSNPTRTVTWMLNDGSGSNSLSTAQTTTVSLAVIESFGSTELVEAGANYFLSPLGGSSGPGLKLSGAAVVAGQFGAAWAPIGAEKTASGYEVAWENTGANQFTVWNTDSNGNYLGNTIGMVSGTDPSLEALETSFQQDLNGDGTVGFNPPPIETFGATELAKLGNNYFVYQVGGSSAPELKLSGAAVVAGQFGAAWAPIGAEATASGYEVAWENVGANQFTVWNTDSSGNYLANAVGTVAGTDPSLEAFETSFQQDVNGDGTVGFNFPAIETFGSTELAKVGSNYFVYQFGGTSAPELKLSGAAVVAGQFGAAWAPVGAEATASGYEVAWENVGANQFTVWNTDSNGNYVTNAIGLVSGTDPSLESLETSFQQDLNGDGTTGFNPPPIESFGSTELVEIGTNYFLYPVGGPAGVELKFSGAAVAAGQFGAGWAPIGAEKTASGYEVAWENVGANQFTVWNTDSSGNYLANAIGLVSGTDPSLEALETSFQQDLNGDGMIGPPHASAAATQSTAINQTIAAGGSLEVSGPSADVITFAGSTGTLIFDQSAEFTGQISGLTGQDQIDLRDVGFGANTTLLYAENTGNTGGILSVGDSTHTANLFLSGQYTTANFTMLSDNAGGTLLYDPPVGASDAQPLAAATRAAAGAPPTLALCADPVANGFSALAPGGTQIGPLASTLAGQSQAAMQPIQHLGQLS